ncbi:MAG: hypothetical protein ACRBB3_04750 [Alphaproteobacteria bacterium]
MPNIMFIIALVAIVVPQNTYARAKVTSGTDIVMPELRSTSVMIDDDDEMPLEPNIGVVKYKKRQPITSMKERVDRLVQGVNKSIPPEFDHYGYEIRRYMAHVGNLEVFENEEYLKDQIKNTRKAAIIYKYWKKALEKEVYDIEEIINNDETISPVIRTAFKQNKTTVRTFLVSLKSWIDSNERLLMHVFNDPEIYEIYYPEIIIANAKANVKFYNLSVIKQTKLKEIRVYRPFSVMVH